MQNVPKLSAVIRDIYNKTYMDVPTVIIMYDDEIMVSEVRN
jgi:hypothetical protein